MSQLITRMTKIRIKSEKAGCKYKMCHLHLISAKKFPLSQHIWQEAETVSPTLCKGDMAPPHSWETIVQQDSGEPE